MILYQARYIAGETDMNWAVYSRGNAETVVVPTLPQELIDKYAGAVR